MAVISYDAPDVLADFAKRNGISYPLLADPGSVTIRQYGVLNTVVDEALGPNGKDPGVQADLQRYVAVTQASERFRGMAFPGTFMLDRQGRVTSRFFEDYYWERNTVSNILMRTGAAAAPVQAMQASTEHLELRAYPSDAAVVLGSRFSLAVEISPRRTMHVYAPGAASYRIVALSIRPQPHLRMMPMAYPPSEIYHFVPLNEQVPVYQRPFTLRTEVVAEVNAEARKAFSGKSELTITGALDYQACDDKICYNPVSLPLSWTVALTANVPGAPPSPGR